MNENVHRLAAERHFEMASKCDEDFNKEKAKDTKTALMVAAAQNFFYAATNAIEAVLARKNLHSFNHEDRLNKMLENADLFDDNIIRSYMDLISFGESYRAKVAYRGENGEKYKKLKQIASLLLGMFKGLK